MDYTIFPVKTNLLTESSVLGHIEVPYERLVELFKEPLAGDGRDSDCEWNIMLMNGHPLAITNYRNGKAYNGREGLPVEQISNWLVRGHYDYDFPTLQEFLEGKTSYVFEAKLVASNKENLIKRLEGMLRHIEEGHEASNNSSDYHSWSITKQHSTELSTDLKNGEKNS